jgi:hypothetical protein
VRGVDFPVQHQDFGLDKKDRRGDNEKKSAPIQKQNEPETGSEVPKKKPANGKEEPPEKTDTDEKAPLVGDATPDAKETKRATENKGGKVEKVYSSKKVPLGMDEAGQGERFSGYGVEVVEYLEMESMDEAQRPLPKPRPWGKVASALFMLTFILGLVHVGAVLYFSSGILTPDEALGGVCEIAGEVRDMAGNPVANATIVVTDSSRSTFTNGDGWYVMRGISQGQHRVEATSEGYNMMSVKVDLRPNLLKSLDFTLEKGGDDISLDESATVDFSLARDSYLWSAPLFLVLSSFALAAALMALRKKASRMTVLLGAVSVASFGFGIGSVLAVVGTILATLHSPRPKPPLKRLRVGMSYPSPKCDAVETASPRRVAHPQEGPSYAPAATDAGAGTDGEEHGAQEHRHGHKHHAHRDHEHRDHEHHDHHDHHAHPGEHENGHEGHHEDSGESGHHEHHEHKDHGAGGAQSHAKRYRRTSPKGQMTCCICIDEIGLGSEYIRCVCGRNIHVKCLRAPSCPECGHPFGKWKEGHSPQ